MCTGPQESHLPSQKVLENSLAQRTRTRKLRGPSALTGAWIGRGMGGRRVRGRGGRRWGGWRSGGAAQSWCTGEERGAVPRPSGNGPLISPGPSLARLFKISCTFLVSPSFCVRVFKPTFSLRRPFLKALQPNDCLVPRTFHSIPLYANLPTRIAILYYEK